ASYWAQEFCSLDLLFMAQYEAWLQPPCEYECTYGNVWAKNLAFYNDILYTATYDTHEVNPAFLHAYDFETGEQVWEFEIIGAEGDAVMTPAVNDSLLFCAAYTVDGLYALDRKTGSQNWFRDIPAFAPVLDDNRLYLFTDSLYCLDIQDGSVNWSEETFNIDYGVPALDDSSCFYSKGRSMYCDHKITGEPIWWLQTWGLDCIALDENYIYTSSRDSIIAVDKSNGEIVWGYHMDEDGLTNQDNKNAIAVTDKYLCFPIWGGLYPDSYDGITVVNKETGTLVWSRRYRQKHVFTPTIANGVVYYVVRRWSVQESTLYAFELSTGDSLWSNSSADYFFQPIVARHSLFVPTLHGVKAFSNLPLAGIDPKPAHSQPDNFTLFQNYPNPFNPVTTISYQLPKMSQVKLSIYNIKGRLVEILVDGISSAGIHSVEWNAEKVGSGIYFYQLETEGYSWVKKLVVMK
ncbi:MAG: PQQ-binding-like beta-propeller repeat protein, partial [bacterium]